MWCPQKNLEDSPHRARRRVTDHSRKMVIDGWIVSSGGVFGFDSVDRTGRRDLPADIPDKAGELARNRCTRLVLM